MGDEAFTEEEISETIRAHKQIIANMRSQHWPMHRKLKVYLYLICNSIIDTMFGLKILNRAKHYIKRHEGELKQSKQAKDIVSKYKTYIERVRKQSIFKCKSHFYSLYSILFCIIVSKLFLFII